LGIINEIKIGAIAPKHCPHLTHAKHFQSYLLTIKPANKNSVSKKLLLPEKGLFLPDFYSYSQASTLLMGNQI
jgi:hypothetical protein